MEKGTVRSYNAAGDSTMGDASNSMDLDPVAEKKRLKAEKVRESGLWRWWRCVVMMRGAL